MNQQSNNVLPLFDLTPGLLDYYSSQAQLMLAQYDNINSLLGPTCDYTAPGDFCEILFRDFLRKFLPAHLSADKGFFYGRTRLDGEDTHCPEIDILIHDTGEHRPIFRMGDFVIVQPQAVRGMIQVKRTFSQTQVRRGVKNVVRAKEHLLRVLEEKAKQPDTWRPTRQLFTAVVGFDDEIGSDTRFYQRLFVEWHIKKKTFALPTIIGSLRTLFVFGFRSQWYQVYNSLFDKKNVFTQLFLHALFSVLDHRHDKMPPFAYPAEMKPITDFSVPQVVKAIFNEEIGKGHGYNEILVIRRTDDSDDWFVKVPDREGFPPHIVVDSEGKTTFTDVLKMYPTTTELFIKRSDKVERFMQLAQKPAQPANTELQT